MQYFYAADLDFYCLNPESAKFVLSLRQLRNRSDYHHNNLVQCLNDPVFAKLAQDWVDKKTKSGLDFAVRAAQLDRIIDPELAAFLQSLRAQFEIFSQIINSELINPPKDIRSLSIAFKKIANQINSDTLKELIWSIAEHKNFIFIDDFINLSKHVVTLAPAYLGSFNPNNRKLGSYKVFDNKLGVIPEKELSWIIHDLKPWVYNQLSQLTGTLKKLQAANLNNEWEMIGL